MYQNYIASAVEILTANTADQEHRRYLTVSFSDLYTQKAEKAEREESVEEIKKRQKQILARLFGGGKK